MVFVAAAAVVVVVEAGRGLLWSVRTYIGLPPGYFWRYNKHRNI